MRKLKSIMLAGAMLLATPVFFSSCQEDSPEIDYTVKVEVTNDFSKVIEAINNGAIKNAEAIAKLTAAIDKMNNDNSEKMELIIQAIASVNNTLDAKLALIEAAMKAQTISLEGKLDLLEQAIKNMPRYDEQLQAIVAAINGLPNYDEQLKAIVATITSVNNTLSTKLAAIEAIIKAQTLSMEGKFYALEAAIKAMPDNSNEIKALKSEIANLVLAVKNGTTTENDALAIIIQKLDALKSSMGIGGGGSTSAYSTEYVDLGLPSGTLWATCNLGANRPEMIGEYYAWGEFITKPTYTKDNYIYNDGKWGKFKKYNGSDSFELTANDDIANRKLGGVWHMPTREQITELFGNCNWRIATYNGVRGATITGPNNNQIFIPFARILSEDNIQHAINSFSFWTKNLSNEDYNRANCVVCDYDNNGKIQGGVDYRYDRFVGMQVRPVREGKQVEAVDLGLPSGNKWATRNIGANKPEEIGNYYAWGELLPKTNYTKDFYRWNKTVDGYTKYNSYDGLQTLEAKDDVATQMFGDGWQIPSANDLKELFNEKYTTLKETERNGVKGHEVTSKQNGKSIFFPKTGEWDEFNIIVPEYTIIACNELETYDSDNQLSWRIEKTNAIGFIKRYQGIPIRPVYTKK